MIDQIARRIPALLCPEGLGRREKGSVLKALYDDRSKAVHGERTEVSANTLKLVRRVASGIVRAMVRWQAAQIRDNKQTNLRRLAEDIDTAADDGISVAKVGIDLSNILPDTKVQKYERDLFPLEDI